MADDSTTKKELKKKVEDYETLFDELRPLIILALNDYYVGDNRDELESKVNELGYDLP